MPDSSEWGSGLWGDGYWGFFASNSSYILKANARNRRHRPLFVVTALVEPSAEEIVVDEEEEEIP
jgi:hypothetical protein